MSLIVNQDDITSLNLNTAEQASYIIQRKKLFKGTIVVAVVYGVLALTILLFALLTPTGRLLFGDKLFAFTLVLIVGMIFIILALVAMVLAYKPTVKENVSKFACPDYWKAVEETALQSANVDPNDAILMKYKCVPDSSLVNLNRAAESASLAYSGTKDKNTYTYVDQTDENYVTTDLQFISSKIGGGKMTCNAMYPDLLQYYSDKNYPDAPTKLACEYVNQCGVSWSSACGKKPSS